jgi:hypothetical protein
MRKLIYQVTTVIIGLSLISGVAYACTSYINHKCSDDHSKDHKCRTLTVPGNGSSTTSGSLGTAGSFTTTPTIPNGSSTTAPAITPVDTPDTVVPTFSGDSSSTS